MRLLRAPDGGDAAREPRLLPVRGIVPGAPALATHPKNVYLPESAVVGPIGEWIGSLFGPEHCEGTVRRLLSADANSHVSARGAAAAKAVADAERRLRRLQSAIEAGVDPAALVEPINRAQEELEAGQEEQRHAPSVQALGRADGEVMIDYVGDVGSALNGADPASLEVIYHPEERTAEVTIRRGTGGERVRCGSCAPTTRLHLT